MPDDDYSTPDPAPLKIAGDIEFSVDLGEAVVAEACPRCGGEMFIVPETGGMYGHDCDAEA